jgi:hypothetical protein
LTIFTEVSDAFDALKTFFKDQGTHVTANTSPINPIDLPDSFDYAELLTFSTTESEGGVGYQIGAAQESIATMAAVSRELDIAVLSKTLIYDNYASECVDESNFYHQSGSYYLGVIKGAPTNGAQC